LGQPLLGQIHALIANSLVTAAPTLAQPALGQRHDLVANNLTAGNPTLGQPSLGGGGADWLVYRGSNWLPADVFARHAGAWKPVTVGWIHRDGTWKQFYN
ncbi:MAG TPA: hypothetical protein VGN75_13640, partial [Kaistia sp.]|nr:hypothetical protein [Kaistia sp.]